MNISQINGNPVYDAAARKDISEIKENVKFYYFDSFAAAVTAVNTNDFSAANTKASTNEAKVTIGNGVPVVDVLKDITLSATAKFKMSVVLNLNTHTVSLSGDSMLGLLDNDNSTADVTINGYGATVKRVGTTVIATNTLIYCTASKITVNGGTYTNYNGIQYGYTFYIASFQSVVEINNATITAVGEYVGYGIAVVKATKVTLNKCNVYASAYLGSPIVYDVGQSMGIAVYAFKECLKLEIFGGTYSGECMCLSLHCNSTLVDATFESCDHGVYFSGAVSYVRNCKFKHLNWANLLLATLEYPYKAEGQKYKAQYTATHPDYCNLGYCYLGSSRNEVNVVMNSCTEYIDPQRTNGYARINVSENYSYFPNTLYISNHTVLKELRVDGDRGSGAGRVFVGKNVTVPAVVSIEGSIGTIDYDTYKDIVFTSAETALSNTLGLSKIIKDSSSVTQNFETPLSTNDVGDKTIPQFEVSGDSTQETIANTNLLPYPYNETTKTTNGITFTDNGDGTIMANGTATADAYFIIVSEYKYSTNDQYYLSGCPIGGSNQSYMLMGYTNSGGSFKDFGSGVNCYTNDDRLYSVRIVIRENCTCNNLVFKPQLQTGSTATAWVRPTGGLGSPSPATPSDIENVGDTLKLSSCGKNLIPYPYYDTTTKTINGVTFTDNGDGTITANGTATVQAYFILMRQKLGIGNYYLFGCPTGGSTSTYSIYFSNNDYTFYKTDIGSGVQINHTKNELITIAINILSGTTVSNLVFKPQLETGTTATSYESYSGNNYTIPLTDTDGTTHTMRKYDKITKHDDGKWYFDCNSTVKTFTGTENWNKSTSYLSIVVPASTEEGRKHILCNYFKGAVSTTFGNAFITGANNDSLIIGNADGHYATLDAWKAELAAWNTAGNPLTVLYQTTTTTSYELNATTQTTLNSIVAQSPTANIYFTNETLPTMSGKYRLDVKRYIDNKFTELQALILENNT